VWRRLALADRAGVLEILRSGPTANGAAPDPRLPYAIVDAVRASVRQARETAGATPALRSSEPYRLAEERLARANRFEASRQPLDALGALWQAADAYARVTAPGAPPPVSAPGATTVAGSVDSGSGAAAGASTRAAQVPPLVPAAPSAAPPAAPATTAAGELPSAAAATSTPAPPTANADRGIATVPPDTDAILGALRRYHDAYKALDVSGVLQVFPTLGPDQVEQLRRTFAGMTAYEIETRQPRVDIGSDVATVRAVVARRMVPRVGRPVANEVDTEFRLRRAGRGWLITDVRAVQ
jgi:hypothetical protein